MSSQLKFTEVIFNFEFIMLHRLWSMNFKHPSDDTAGHICERHDALWRNFGLIGFKDGERIK